MTTQTIQRSPQSEVGHAPRILLQRQASESIPNGQLPGAVRYIASEQLTKEEMTKIDEVLKTFDKSKDLPLGERPLSTAAVVLHDMDADNKSDIGTDVVRNKSGSNELQMGEGAAYFVDRAGAIEPHRGQMFATRRPTATKYELGEPAGGSHNPDELSESERESLFRRVYESMPESEKQPTTIPLRPTAFSAATTGLSLKREKHYSEPTALNDVEREHEKMLTQFKAPYQPNNDKKRGLKRNTLGTTASWTVRAFCQDAPLPNLDCLKVNRLFALRDQRIPQRMNVELYRRTGDATNKYPDAQLDSAISIYLSAARALGYWPELRTHLQEDRGIPGAHVDPRNLDFEALQDRIRHKIGHKPDVRYSKPASSILDGYQYPHPIQPKLLVNKPGDHFEQEADRVADQVMRMREPKVQRQCGCGKHSAEGECLECKRKKDANVRGLQRVATSPTGAISAPPIVDHVVSSSGSPLPDTTRSFMESRFGQDFSRVRIHTDGAAAESARAVSSKAYALGSHVVFGDGFFQPSTFDGQRLIAHELTHTLQQRSEQHESIQRQSEGNDTHTDAIDESDESDDVSLEWLDKAVTLLREYAAEIGEAALGFIPIVGDLYDVVTAIYGETLISREKLDPLDRLLTLAGLIPTPAVSGKILRLGRHAVELTLKRLGTHATPLLKKAIRKGRAVLTALWLRASPIVEKHLSGIRKGSHGIEARDWARPRERMLERAKDDLVIDEIEDFHRRAAKVGLGTTGEAIQHEVLTGELLSKSGHIQKADNGIRHLEDVLKNPILESSDREIVKDIISDLQHGLSQDGPFRYKLKGPQARKKTDKRPHRSPVPRASPRTGE